MLLYGVLLAWQIWRLLFVPHGQASTWTWSRDAMEVPATGAGIRQQFLMNVDGLEAVWLQPVALGSELAGTVIVDVADLTGNDPVPVARVTVPAAQLYQSRQYRIDLGTAHLSRNRTYTLHVRHVGAGQDAMRFRARRDRVPPHGAFHVDDDERWGALIFEATSSRATLPYWKDELLRAWPSWMRSWWVVGGVLLVFNVALFRSCALAVGASGSAAAAGARTRDDAGPWSTAKAWRNAGAGAPALQGHGARGGGVGRAAVLAVASVVVAGTVVVLWPAAPLATATLADHLGDAAIHTTTPSLLDAVSVEAAAFGGRAYRVIVALPTSRLAWTIDVAPDAVLRGGAAMRPDVWLQPSDGANMDVYVEEGGERTLVARYTLTPYLFEDHRTLFPVEVPLAPWAGRRITLAFETDPERWGNAVNDVPVWVEPRIEWPRTAEDGAGVIPRS